MSPKLIGYFPKRTIKRPDWLACFNVEEICSVSDCISKAPVGWIDQWRHNECWAFDTQELAWSVVAADARSEFELYAYKMFPVRFDRGQKVAIDFPTLDVEPLASSFERLSYDAVSRSCDSTFECSPLSCNGMAKEFAVNRYCLIDTETEGFRIAREFSVSVPEPGPYYLLEVWREKTGA